MSACRTVNSPNRTHFCLENIPRDEMWVALAKPPGYANVFWVWSCNSLLSCQGARTSSEMSKVNRVLRSVMGSI